MVIHFYKQELTWERVTCQNSPCRVADQWIQSLLYYELRTCLFRHLWIHQACLLSSDLLSIVSLCGLWEKHLKKIKGAGKSRYRRIMFHPRVKCTLPSFRKMPTEVNQCIYVSLQTYLKVGGLFTSDNRRAWQWRSWSIDKRIQHDWARTRTHTHTIYTVDHALLLTITIYPTSSYFLITMMLTVSESPFLASPPPQHNLKGLDRLGCVLWNAGSWEATW